MLSHRTKKSEEEIFGLFLSKTATFKLPLFSWNYLAFALIVELLFGREFLCQSLVSTFLPAVVHLQFESR